MYALLVSQAQGLRPHPLRTQQLYHTCTQHIVSVDNYQMGSGLVAISARQNFMCDASALYWGPRGLGHQLQQKICIHKLGCEYDHEPSTNQFCH